VGGLVPEGLGPLAVVLLHFLGGLGLLGLARLVGGELRRRGAVPVLLLQIGLDLLAALERSGEIARLGAR
jgi:hypothetical protein